MIRADLTGDVRARIVARDFRELTGREDLSAMEVMTLMNLMIEGKAAAWNRCDEALAPMARLFPSPATLTGKRLSTYKNRLSIQDVGGTLQPEKRFGAGGGT
ncbi:hypothetical protein [Roseovarius sp. MBR-6]|uniref:hypothetical protein n=1 Tax=Roseovarius sp. MBR-6 TaxID=3156459 RepID=UPI003391CA6E